MSLKQETAVSILKAYIAKFEDLRLAYGEEKYDKSCASLKTDAKTLFKRQCEVLKNNIGDQIEKHDNGEKINCWPWVEKIIQLQNTFHQQLADRTKKDNTLCCCLFNPGKSKRFRSLYSTHLKRVSQQALDIIKSAFPDANDIFENHFSLLNQPCHSIVRYICNREINQKNYRYSVFKNPKLKKNFMSVECQLDDIMKTILSSMTALQTEHLSKTNRKYNRTMHEFDCLDLDNI